jgi:hypothetical protein
MTSRFLLSTLKLLIYPEFFRRSGGCLDNQSIEVGPSKPLLSARSAPADQSVSHLT